MRTVQPEELAAGDFPDLDSDAGKLTRRDEELLCDSGLLSIFDHLPVGVVVFSAPDGRLVLQNRASALMTGKLPVGTRMNQLERLWQVEYADGVPLPEGTLPMSRALEGCERCDSRYVIKVAGSNNQLAVTFVPLRAGGGEMLAAIVVTSEMTGQKLSEAALRESEDRYRDLVEHTKDLMVTHDLNGKVLSSNRGAAELLGYEPEEIVGRNVYESVAPHYQHLVSLYLEEVGRSGLATGIMRVTTRHGEARLCEYEATLRTTGVAEPVVRAVARDVTERMRAERALRKSEERFSKAFNASPNPMFIARLADDVVLDVNDAFLSTSGYVRQQVLGHTVSDLGLWPELPEPEEQRRAVIANGAIRNVESVFRTGTGELRVMLLSAEIIDIGGVACVLAAASDITERKRAEESLRESEAKLQVITSQIPGLIWTTDADLRLITARGSGAAVSGDNNLDQYIGQTLHNIYATAEANHPAVAAHLKALAGESAVYESESDGYSYDVRVEPLRGVGGEIIGCIGLAHDITERKVGEEERLSLLAMERRARAEAERERVSLQALIDQIADGLAVFDETGAITSANRHAQRIYGMTLDEMLARGDVHNVLRDRAFDDDGHPISPEDLAVPSALREERTVQKQFWYLRPDGQRLLLSVTASPFFVDDNKLVGATALVRDVTEQHREHNRAQQADKLRALGQLASGVAHNFNNALAAVLGYAQLAIPKAKDKDLQKYLRVIEQAAKDAARMVERIQNFARGNSKRDRLSALRIGDIVRDAVDITRPRWRDDSEALGIKYEVVLKWDSPTDLLVDGESSELREVFVNIIFNALDAMPAGGSLSINGKIEKKSLIISFTDTGEGMTEETTRRIFEPFFSTKGAKGMGMGLAESYRIIERHGGRIDVESRLGMGTTIRIQLPMAQGFEIVEELKGEDDPVRPARMMVIDDEEFVRNVLSTLLETWGHDVVGVSSAEEAIALIEGRDFDLVFTDLAMPNTDGIAAARGIKALRPQTKVILMSGYSAEAVSERSAECDSIDATISKPFNLAEIRNAIKELVSAPA